MTSRSSAYSVVLAASVTLLAAACRDGTGPPMASSLDLTPPSAEMSVGETQQFTAIPRDIEGRRLQLDVDWRSSNPSVVTVTPAGLASAVSLGSATITASVQTEQAQAVVNVVPGEPAQIQVASGGNQEGRSGRELPAAVIVRVTDRTGTPVPDAPVTFDVVSGSGSVTPSTTRTNSDGRATARWTLGTGGDDQVLRAFVPSTPAEAEIRAAVIPSGLISGRVFMDSDRDGFSSGEPGVEGVTISLRTTSAELGRTTTELDGRYAFHDLGARAYTVQVESSSLPDGLGHGGPDRAEVVLAFDDTAAAHFSVLVPVAAGTDVVVLTDVPLGVPAERLLIGNAQAGLKAPDVAGSAGIHVSDAVSTMVAIVDVASGTPMLLGATTDAHLTGDPLQLSPRTTAMALVSRSPVFPLDDPHIVRELQELIAPLPETERLSEIIATAVEGGVDYWDDSAFLSAYQRAVDATVEALRALATAQGGGDLRTPSNEGGDPDSGVRVTATSGTSAVRQSFDVRNGKPRAVDVYAFPIGAGGRPRYDEVGFSDGVGLPRTGEIPSSLLGLAQFMFTLATDGWEGHFGEADPRTLRFDFAPGERDEFLIAAYGLGFDGLGEDLLRGEDFGKMLYPTARTLVLDVLLPPVLSIAGLPREAISALHLPQNAQRFLELADRMSTHLSVGSELAGALDDGLRRGDYAAILEVVAVVFEECPDCVTALGEILAPTLGSVATALVIETQLCVTATVATGGTAGLACGAWWAWKLTKALLAISNSAYIVIESADAELREEFIVRRPLVGGASAAEVLVHLGSREAGECLASESCSESGTAEYDLFWPLAIESGGDWVLTASPEVSACVNVDVLSEARSVLRGTYLHRGTEPTEWSISLDPGDYLLGMYTVRSGACTSSDAALLLSLDRQPLPPSATGRLTGRVADASTGAGLPGATVSFGESGSVETGSSGSYTSGELPVGRYDLTVSKDGYIAVTAFGQEVRADETITLETVPLVPFSTSPGAISGAVRNARDNGPVGGATVELREGMNATTGTLAATAVAEADGGYRIGDVAAGTYSLLVEAEGFTQGTKTGIVIGDAEVGDQDVVLSPLSTDDIRIVLTWGSDPSDLDSHLTGPGVGAERFHVFYASRGSLTAAPHAQLDRDDVTSFGPETITITQLRDGTYRYSVFNFSDRSSTTSRRLADSSAKVELYIGADPPRAFHVPNSPGNLWTVFEIVDGEVVTVNGMTFHNTGSRAVPAPPRGDLRTDSEVIGVGPPKKIRR